jgi:imidazolonepropionase
MIVGGRRGSTASQATDDIVNKQLPDIRRRINEGELHVDNVDVFCEQGVFDVHQTKRILEAGQQIGLAANFHGEELHCLNSAEVRCVHCDQ